jgi:hypothetical protein
MCADSRPSDVLRSLGDKTRVTVHIEVTIDDPGVKGWRCPPTLIPFPCSEIERGLSCMWLVCGELGCSSCLMAK